MRFRTPCLFVSLVLSPLTLLAADCLESEALKALDRQYEEALRVGDPAFMEKLLLEEFVWVHNHAVSAEPKSDLVKRLGEGHEKPLARTSEEVQVRRAGNTAVITGFTTVEKADADGSNRRANRYHFMRTYVADGEECRLLAGQTMKVWSSAGEEI